MYMENMETLLDHFYSIKTPSSKIIQNVKCLLWDKQTEMKTIIDDIKLSYKFYPEMYEKSVQCVYMDYCSKAKAKFNYKTVSKKYFEKYINRLTNFHRNIKKAGPLPNWRFFCAFSHF